MAQVPIARGWTTEGTSGVPVGAQISMVGPTVDVNLGALTVT
jgi:hypothetical protein